MKHVLLICIIVILSNSSLQAKYDAKRAIDSLEKALKVVKADTTKLNIQTLLCDYKKNDDPAGVIEQCNLLMKTARKLDRLRSLGNLYRTMSEACYNQGDYAKASLFAERGDSIGKQTKNKQLQAKCIGRIGLGYYAQGEYEKAVEYSLKSCKMAHEIGDKMTEADGYLYTGAAYIMLAGYSLALENFQKSLIISKELGIKYSQATVLANMGVVYFYLNDYKNARDKYTKALGLFTELDSKLNMGMQYMNIAGVYADGEKNISKALEYYDKALVIFREKGDKLNEGQAIRSIGLIYVDSKDYQNALKNITVSLAIDKQFQRVYQISQDYGNLAAVFVGLKNYKRALKYADSSIVIADKINAPDELVIIHQLKSIIYEKTLQPDKALAEFKDYVRIKDSISDDNVKNDLARKEMQFDFKVKEANTKADQDKKEALAKAEIASGIFQRNAFISGGGLLFLVSLLLFGRVRSERRSKKIISEEKLKSEEKSKILEITNSVKDKLFSIISHDLRSPLTSMDTVLELLNSDDLDPEKAKQYNAELSLMLRQNMDLLDNLLYWSTNQMRGLKINKRIIDLTELVDETTGLVKGFANKKRISITEDIGDGAKAYADTGMARLVLRNLLSNAIKFTPDDGNIHVAVYPQGENIKVEVTDNGTGMTQERIAEIFSELATESEYGTNNEKGFGIGLKLCREFVEENGGILEVESTIGKGSSFSFTIPKAA